MLISVGCTLLLVYNGVQLNQLLKRTEETTNQLNKTMSTKLPTLCRAVFVIVSIVLLTTAVSHVGADKKMTCRHNGDAKRKDWKTCVRGTNADHPSYLYPGLNIPKSLSLSALPAMEIPIK